MTKTAIILCAQDAEESELVITTDVLRRAGINVTLAGLGDSDIIQCVQKTKIQVDKPFKELLNNDYDLVVIPGGPGHKHIAECQKTGEFLRRHEKAGKLIGAICGGPLALQAHNIGEGGNMTLFPKEKDNMAKGAHYNYTGDRVTVWKNIVTSQAPGTAFEFATKLVELLLGGDKAKETCDKLLCQCPSMTSQAPRIR